MSTSALIALLGGAVEGKIQHEDGSYGPRQTLTPEDLDSHFTGEITVGISLVANKRSRFLTIDLDRHFEQRLRLIAGELRRRKLDAATICTTGSDAGRGKVVVFFDRARAAGTLRAIGDDIVARASTNSAWGIGPTTSIDVFPKSGEGGVVRIGGRNRHPSRNALALDRLFNIHGEPCSFADVVPHRIRRQDPVPIAASPLQPWVERLRSESWDFGIGSAGNYRNAVRLGAEAFRVYGPSGRDVLDQWAAEIWSNSPALRQPSPSGDKRERRTFDRWFSGAWNRAVSLNMEHYTAPEEGLDNVPFCEKKSAKKMEALLRILGSWASRKGLSRDAIGISIRCIAEALGCGITTAYRRVNELERVGRLVIIDRGIPYNRLAPMILGLVPIGTDPETVRKRAAGRGNVIGRRKLRAALSERANAPAILQKAS